MRSLTWLVVLHVVVAGCMGGSGDPPSTSPPATEPTLTRTPEATLDVAAPLPDWSPGLAWTYAVEIPGEPTRFFNMMVAEDRAEDGLWVVATDDRALAAHHALYSTNPVLGRIGQETLSPFQDGAPVEMFQFPLTDRKSWTAVFFGESLTFTAVFDDAVPTLPGVWLPGFRITAEGASGQRVEYNYVEAVRWFTQFVLYGSDGTKQIHLSLQEFGDTYEGPYWFFRGRDRAAETFTESSNPADPVQFEVAAGDGFGAVAVGLVARGMGDQTAVVNVTLRDPAGAAAYSELLLLPKNELRTRIADVPSQNGAWSIEVLMVGQAEVEVRAAGLLFTAQGTV